MNESMFCTMVNEYVDDELRPDERIAFEEHLIQCAACQDELEKLLALQYRIVSLPKVIQPQRDLWPRIESSLQPELQPLVKSIEERKNGKAKVLYLNNLSRSVSWYLRAAAVVLFILGAGAVWLVLRTSQDQRSASETENSVALQAPATVQHSTGNSTVPVTKTAKPSDQVAGVQKSVSQNNNTTFKFTHDTQSSGEMKEFDKRLKRGLQLATTSMMPSSAGKVSGLVTDELGKPVRGITVEIASIHRTVLTDDNGKFEFFGLLPDAYTFQVHGAGYQRNAISGVKIIPGFTTQVNFLLRSGSIALTDVAMNKEQLFAEATPSASLDELPLASYARPPIQSNRLKVEGKVTDERGRSIVGAVVLVLGTKRGGYSDNEGTFHIYGVPPGTYTLQATASGYQSKDTISVQVFPDFPVEVNIALEAGTDR